LISGNEVAVGECRAGRLLAIDPTGNAPLLDGERTRDPAFGTPALFIGEREKEMAEALGYVVVDAGTTIVTHLGEVLRGNAHRLLGRQEVQHLIDVLARSAPKLVDDVIPNMLAIGDVVRVLRNLVREQVSIRDLRSILEALAELATSTKDPEQLTELVRERLVAQITGRLRRRDGSIAATTLDARLEEALRRSLRDIATGNGAPLDPELLRAITRGAEQSVARFAALEAPPAVIVPPDLRRYVRAILERKLPQIHVVSFREIDPNVPLRIVETLGPTALAVVTPGAAPR
jgi:flagellar biosynthesis protein FlhA